MKSKNISKAGQKMHHTIHKVQPRKIRKIHVPQQASRKMNFRLNEYMICFKR